MQGLQILHYISIAKQKNKDILTLRQQNAIDLVFITLDLAGIFKFRLKSNGIYRIFLNNEIQHQNITFFSTLKP